MGPERMGLERKGGKGKDGTGKDWTGEDWSGWDRRQRNNKNNGGTMKLTDEGIAELKALEDKRGRLTPAQVVEAARATSSALHDCFEWDDSVAAEQYRIDQAREIIRRVKIIVTVEEKPFRVAKYVRDPELSRQQPVNDQGEQEPERAGYVAVMRVKRVDSRELVRNELRAVLALVERTEGIVAAKDSDLPGVRDEVAAIKAKVIKLIDSL